MVEKDSLVLAARFKKVWEWMTSEDIALVMLEDTEGRRDQNIRWLTGHPGDALLFIVDKGAALVAWDLNLAKLYASSAPLVSITSYNDYDRSPRKTLTALAKKFNIKAGSRVEIPSVTPYPVFLDYVGELGSFDILCREKGAAAEIDKMRAVKDEHEIAITRKAANITNELIDLLERNVREEKIKTESDAALLIEVEARLRGCEGTSFATLAAGPARSFAIHAFPGWTCAPFGTEGFSILDFGVKLDGYCTDVTLTFARALNPKQEKMAGMVEKAYKLALSMAHNGTQTKDIAAAVDASFTKARKQMPHGLGHGIGLQEHEYPVLRNRSNNEWVLEPGMLFTIEPGLYDPQLGGCRLENDVLATETGPEVLTNSHIVYL